MDLAHRIAAAEADLNAALEHTQDMTIARQQVLDALDDLRLYRNLLALHEWGNRRPDPPVLIPRQARRRVLAPTSELARPVPPPYRGAAVGYHDRRDGSGRFAPVGRSRQ